MATNDPKSRLTESPLNSPAYTSPDGVTDPRRDGGTMSGASAPRPEVGQRAEQTPGEKIGRFFRRAMERLSGHHDEDEWRRRDDRNQRDRDIQDRSRAGDRSAEYRRSAERAQARSDWRDLGRSRDDRKMSYRGGPSSDTGGSYERLQAERRSPGDEQGAYGAQSGYGEEGRYAREESRSTPGPSFENRGGQSLGQRSLGPSESYGLAGVPSDRPMGSDRGFVGDQGRDDWNRDDWSRSDPYRDRWAAERSRQSGATGM